MTEAPRVGLGVDLHRLAEGGPLVLGGVRIDADVHAVGHSDADVLLHAVTDAVLAACGAGDIGDLFPPGDPATAGADSRAFVEAALACAEQRGLRVVSVSAVVIAERPRLGPAKVRIRDSVAAMLGLPADRIGLSAKTAEGLGDIGAGRAIEARAVALLVTRGDSVEGD